MQTTNLNPALSPNNVLQRNGTANGANIASATDGGQFSALLNSQLAQAPAAPQAPVAQAPAPAPKPDSAKPVQAEQPAQPDPAPAPQAGQDKTASADGAKDADAKDGDDDAGKADAQAPADPASAMLALLASLQPGAKQAPATPTGAAQAFDNLSGNAGKGKRFDAGQLSALQAAIKASSKDGAGAAAADGKTFSAATIKNPALAAAGAALGTDDKATALAADKTAGGDVPGKVSTTLLKADPNVSLDAAALSLQQARAAAEQAAPAATPLAGALQAAQPAAFDAAQSVAAADQLSAQVGTEAWENQVGQKVVYMVGSEEQTASLTLNPPDLGPMQVVLSVSNDQASVTFSSNQQEVRQALENALPRLREMMSESGIALGNATVNAGTQDGGQARQQDGSPRGGRNSGRARGIAGVDSADGTDAAPRVVTRSIPLGESGMVDIFA
ncbi:flagellar hook-length control protein FliK [Massilia sp. 9096]|uniref:flagellar hook-length control protein FliK n=1 Tax=Massilia sp. 9096 TaxID=1500894 RepID=UPI00056D5858|nr:flagellar hook-length control protein FliK [Massilia sp. 9096]